MGNKNCFTGRLDVKAFTLIELLVVVLIIGILAAVALPQYRIAVDKARAAEAMILVRAVAEAEKTHYLANGSYTTSMENLVVNVSDSQTKNWEMVLDLANDTDKPVVYARRANTTMNVDCWYIYYTLKDNKLWCGAYNGDVLGNRRCRSIGNGEAQACVQAAINCYLIQ